VLGAAVLIALALGGVFKRSGIQNVVLVPVTKEKDGYRVTVDNIIARRKPAGSRARLDLILTIERLDRTALEHDPYLAAEAWILKEPYRPDSVIKVPADGLDVPEMGYALPPLKPSSGARRILSFHDVPETWMAVDLNLLVAGSQPEPDIVLTGIDPGARGRGLPEAHMGRTDLEVLSVTRIRSHAGEGGEATLITVREKSRLIAPGKGWSRIGVPLGRATLVDDEGRVVGSLSQRTARSSLTRGEYLFSVEPARDAPGKMSLEFVSSEAMLKRAIGFRFEGMTTLSPG
jgi:hypothetical protein